MMSDKELLEREQLQREAEEEQEKANQRFKPFMVVWGHVGFDMRDPETRLIGKVDQILTQTSPERKTLNVVELYWRTPDGNYFKLVYDEESAVPMHVDTAEAHHKMNTMKHYRWFLTDTQKKELQVADFQLANARAERNPVRDPNKDD